MVETQENTGYIVEVTRDVDKVGHATASCKHYIQFAFENLLTLLCFTGNATLQHHPLLTEEVLLIFLAKVLGVGV